MASKCSCITQTLLPLLILLISLFQLYFQYSSILTPRDKELDIKDKRQTIYSFRQKDFQLDLNLEKIKESFQDSPLMNINYLKNATLKGFEKLNEKREEKLDQRIYMLFYLMCRDLLYIIIIYIFYFEGFKAGIIKITFQAFKFYFSIKRLKRSNPNLCSYQIIKNYIDYIQLRDLNFFSPEGFEIFEHICNYVILLDLIWLIILFKKRCSKKDEENYITLQKQEILFNENDSIEKEDSNETNNIIINRRDDDIINDTKEDNDNNISDNSNQKGKLKLEEEEENEEEKEISEEIAEGQGTK
jgi:hypothetical protein